MNPLPRLFGTAEPHPLPLNLPISIRDAAFAITLTPADLTPLLGPANRFTASERITEIETYLLHELADAGWETRREPVVNALIEGANIVALKPGDISELIVVGAHYDTVSETPGADDNAAGVAALISLARALAPFRFQRTIALVAFDFEETGFSGSLAFVGSYRASIRAALILECIAYTDSRPNSQIVPPRFDLLYPEQIGRLGERSYRGDWLAVAYRRFSAHLAALYASAASEANLLTIALRDPTDLSVIGPLLQRYFPAARHFARSDHLPFWLANLPALQLTDSGDFRNPHYHQPTDTPDTVDYAFLSKVTEATALTVAHLAGP